jgi:predicted dehydrogenase
MELVAVVDGSRERAEEVGKQFKVPFFTSHKELIKAGIAEAVMIATPHPLHAPVAIDCMKAKLHVISEKPLAEKVSSADKMIKAAKANRVKFGVMFQRRFEPAIAAAIELVKAGKIGKVHRAMLISPEYRSQAYYDSGTWRATWKYEGGGVLMNQAPHVIDIFVQLAGEPVSVSGKIDTSMHHIEVEDVANATLKYKDGGVGYLYASTNEPKPGQMIEIYGDKGKLVWRDSEIKFYEYSQPISKFTKKNKDVWASPEVKEVKVKVGKYAPGTHLLFRNFARHLLYKEELKCSGESGLASLELANAIMLSSWQERELKLPISRRVYDSALKEKREKSTFKKKAVKTKRVTDPNQK